MQEKSLQIYESLTASERFGLQFGMFPVDKVKGITREESIDLMKLGKERGYK